MTEIEELIEAAQKVLKAWHHPSMETLVHPQTKSWQKVMEDREVPVRIGRQA